MNCPFCGAPERSDYGYLCGRGYSPHRTSKCFNAELENKDKRIAQLESELESHAWSVSPAMAQATIEQLANRIVELEAALRKAGVQ